MAISKTTFAERLEQIAADNRGQARAPTRKAGKWRAKLLTATQVTGGLVMLCFAVKLSTVILVGTAQYDRRADAAIQELDHVGPYLAPLLRQDPATRFISDLSEKGLAAL